ncbi:DapH/DapD/GlmU-related protein, partial [Chryseobacterium sp. SIMBA_038]
GAAAHPISFLSTSNIQYSNTLMRGHEDTSFKRKVKYEYDRDTIIGHDVWIGAKSVIKSGITIGHGSIVAALSFVNKDVPPYAIVGGIPAKILKFRFPEEIITDLLE